MFFHSDRVFLEEWLTREAKIQNVSVSSRANNNTDT